MNIIKFDVEFHGDREVTINGKNVLGPDSHGFVDEKIFIGQLDAQQQHAVMCMLRQLAEKVWHDYQQGRVNRGEISPKELRRLRF